MLLSDHLTKHQVKGLYEYFGITTVEQAQALPNGKLVLARGCGKKFIDKLRAIKTDQPIRSEDQFEAAMLEKNLVTFKNAIVYRGYKIYHADSPYLKKWAFTHSDYDGAEDAHDHRTGSGNNIEDCIKLINEQILDNE